MGAADLDDVGPALGLGIERLVEVAERRQELLDHLRGGGDVHGRRVGVVGRLAHVDVIVGMHRLLGAERAAQDLDRPVGDHLVGVHVGLGTGAGLPDDEREVGVELTVDHLLGCRDDRLAELLVELAEIAVDLGCGALQHAERLDDGLGLLFPADLEIAERALRLRAPIDRCVDVDGAEGVGFNTGGQALTPLLSRRSSGQRRQGRAPMHIPPD